MYIGDKIKLRELKSEDLNEIMKYVNDYNLYSSFTDSAPLPKTVEFQRLWMENQISNENIITFAIANKDTDDFIGTCQLREIDMQNYLATLSIIIGTSENSGKGYGTDAIKQLLRFAFLELNLNRVQLEVYEDNFPAIRLYEKCGFVREGAKTEQIFRRGKYSTQIVYSILKEDFSYDI